MTSHGIYFSLGIFKSKPHLNCLSAEDTLCSIARFSCTLSAQQCFRAVLCGASWKFSVHVQPVSGHLVHHNHPAPPGNQNWDDILNNSEFIQYSDFLPSNGGPNRVFGKTEDYGFKSVKKVKTHFWLNEEMKTEDFSIFYHVKSEEWRPADIVKIVFLSAKIPKWTLVG